MKIFIAVYFPIKENSLKKRVIVRKLAKGKTESCMVANLLSTKCSYNASSLLDRLQSPSWGQKDKEQPWTEVDISLTLTFSSIATPLHSILRRYNALPGLTSFESVSLIAFKRAR